MNNDHLSRAFLVGFAESAPASGEEVKVAGTAVRMGCNTTQCTTLCGAAQKTLRTSRFKWPIHHEASLAGLAHVLRDRRQSGGGETCRWRDTISVSG